MSVRGARREQDHLQFHCGVTKRLMLDMLPPSHSSHRLSRAGKHKSSLPPAPPDLPLDGDNSGRRGNRKAVRTAGAGVIYG